MLRLPVFRYLKPKTLDEAASMLQGEGAGKGEMTRVVAGGTDLWPNMKRRHQKAGSVISLMQIPDLRGVHLNGEVRIGATTLLSEIEHHADLRSRFPSLIDAIASISSPPLRNMGTLGGNLCVDTRCTYYNQTEDWRRSIDYCMKEEGTICWVATSSPRCWAHAASDSAPMLSALKARIGLRSAGGERVIPIDQLYRDDGIDYLRKRHDELVTHIFLPAESDASHLKTSFWKLRRRGSIDFAVLSVAVALRVGESGVVEDARIVLGAVSSAPVVASQAAEALIGTTLSEESIAEAAALARKPATPLDNTDFQAQWRGAMVVRYTEAALREAAGIEPRNLPPHHSRHLDP